MASPHNSGTERADVASALSDDTRAVNIRSMTLTSILALMVMYTLYLAAPLFMPLTVSFLVSLMFAPAVRGLKLLRIPPPVSAVMILTTLLALAVGALYGLSGPATQWIDKAPQELRRLEYKVEGLVGPMEALKEARKELKKAAPGDSDSGGGQGPVRWSPTQWLLTSTWDVAYGLGVGVIFLYFQLASGDLFLRKLVRVLPAFEDKRVAVDTVHRIQRSIAVFLSTITAINVCLGAIAGGLFYLIGLPNPLLFGVLVGTLNFAPYLGALISATILLLVSLLSFDNPSHIVVAPGLVLALNVIEGQLITPTLAGHRLELSPLAVFVSITLWGWMWGIVGILIAVPLVASVKLVCDRIAPLQPIAEFLGH